MISRTERILIALMLSLVSAGATLIVTGAQESAPPSSQTSSECAPCHTEFRMTWQNGAHGQSGTDPVFLEQWTAQGKPGACLVCHTTGYDPAAATYEESGVTCQACHTPAPVDHPKSPMPVDRSTDLCGRCHSDTRFGWADWKISTHYQRGMDCTTCHDPHSASIRNIPGPRLAERSDAISVLCINCHEEHSRDFPSTPHHLRGVSCANCHVRPSDTTTQTPHAVPDHSFSASLESCNSCHAEQMHRPAEGTESAETVAAQPSSDLQLAAITPDPNPVGPLGFSLMAGLIGLAAGMILAPWLERWYKRTDWRGRRSEDYDQA